MRACFIQDALAPPAPRRAIAALADLLSVRHEVRVVEVGDEPSPRLRGLPFAGPAHERSAAALEAIRDAYGESGPDYVEVSDAGALGLVAMQAQRSGDPLLRGALFAVRIAPSSELRAFHNGTLAEPETWRVAQLEREQLRLADRLIWPGGDTLDLYRRYYGDAALELPEAVRIGLPLEPVSAAPAPVASGSGGPLTILFADDLERSRGALDLVEACLLLAEEDWRLTLVGADTDTAPMGHSLRLTIEAMGGDDERIAIEDRLPIADLRRRLPGFDLLVAPPRVEAWSEAAVEALRAGVPVLATPVGGLTEIVADGVDGWHCDGIGPESLLRSLSRLQRERGEPARLRGAGTARIEALADPAAILAAYEQLGPTEPVATASASAPAPLVSGVIPFYGNAEHVSEAVASLLAQTHPEIEVVIVNDGSFAPADAILADLARDPRVTVVTQPNAGESAARRLGILLARGEHVVLLDADNALEPEFVERALWAFDRDPRLAYVTCWLRMVDAEGREFPDGLGFAPLGNAVLDDEEANWNGDALAIVPRRLVSELGFSVGDESSMHSDWELYRWLRAERRFGAVIPERLARYRIVPGSLLRGHSDGLMERGWKEGQTRNMRRGMRWTAEE